MQGCGNQDTILKFIGTFIAIYGVVCGFVKIFAFGIYVGSFMVGLVIIAICCLILAGLWTSYEFLQYFSAVKNNTWLGVLFIVVGALFAGTDGFSIACWVIFWFWGIVLIALGFVGKGGGGGGAGAASSQPMAQSEPEDPYTN
jgi:hypothetical protein